MNGSNIRKYFHYINSKGKKQVPKGRRLGKRQSHFRELRRLARTGGMSW